MRKVLVSLMAILDLLIAGTALAQQKPSSFSIDKAWKTLRQGAAQPLNA